MAVTKHTELSSAQARSMAVSAQGLQAATPFSSSRLDVRHLRWAFQKLGVLQIDAVNAIARSHLLVLRARLGGSHDGLSKLLDHTAYERRELTEYWCHEASYLPVDDLPLFRWRMHRAENGEVWGGIRRFATENPEFVEEVANYVALNGPVNAGQLQKKPKGSGTWWAWSEAKVALEWLFWTGQVAISKREKFTRFYDLPAKVLSAQAMDDSVCEIEAHRQLIRKAGEHLGVAAAEDLIDYFRLPKVDGKHRLMELVENKELLPVQVEGWDRVGYISPDAKVTSGTSKSVLLSPFDPLVWFRPRTQRLFNFKYRLEIYVPAAKRVHGYYVLPFLHANKLCARVDVKADTKAGVLRVPAVHAEAEGMNDDAVETLACELWALAAWRNLETIKVGQRGDLARRLRKVIHQL